METFTIIDGTSVRDVQAHVSGERVFLAPDAVERALGWRLNAEGLCQGDRCIPLRDRSELVADAGIELAALASLLDRPLALDLEARAAALGTSAAERTQQLDCGAAPDFELPDLAGERHRLAHHRGKKVLLIAYASW